MTDREIIEQFSESVIFDEYFYIPEYIDYRDVGAIEKDRGHAVYPYTLYLQSRLIDLYRMNEKHGVKLDIEIFLLITLTAMGYEI